MYLAFASPARFLLARANLDSLLLRHLHNLGRRIEPHWLTVQERACKDGRFMTFKPCRHINQQRKTRGMRLGKPVFTKALNLPKDLLGKAG